jgi:hypothetical protein
VGTGTLHALDVVVVAVDDVVQGYTDVEIVGAGGAGPDGGFLDLQADREQLVPGQKSEQ